MVIAFLGQCGSGKTTAAQYLKTKGFRYLSLDIAKQKSRIHKSNELISLYGEAIITNGKFDVEKFKSVTKTTIRKPLNERSLEESDKLLKAQIIMLNYAYEFIYNEAKNESVIDIPFIPSDSSIIDKCDKIIWVKSDEEISIKRFSEREKISLESAKNILSLNIL